MSSKKQLILLVMLAMFAWLSYAGNITEINYKSMTDNAAVKINGSIYPMSKSLVYKGYKRFKSTTAVTSFSIIENSKESTEFNISRNGLYKIEGSRINYITNVVSEDNEFIELYYKSNAGNVDVQVNCNSRGNERLTMEPSRIKPGYKHLLLPASKYAGITFIETGKSITINEPGIYTLDNGNLKKESDISRYAETGVVVDNITSTFNAEVIAESTAPEKKLMKGLVKKGSNLYEIELDESETDVEYSFATNEKKGSSAKVIDESGIEYGLLPVNEDKNTGLWRSQNIKLKAGKNTIQFMNNAIEEEKLAEAGKAPIIPEYIRYIGTEYWKSVKEYNAEHMPGLDSEYVKSIYNMGVYIVSDKKSDLKLTFINGKGPEYVKHAKGILIGEKYGKYFYRFGIPAVAYSESTFMNGRAATTFSVKELEYVIYSDGAAIARISKDMGTISQKVEFKATPNEKYGDISRYSYLGTSQDCGYEILERNGLKYEIPANELRHIRQQEITYKSETLESEMEKAEKESKELTDKTGLNQSMTNGPMKSTAAPNVPQISSVYQMPQTRQDYVNTRTGKLEYETNDFEILGKNGHNFTLKMKYEDTKWSFNIPKVEIKDITSDGSGKYFQYIIHMGDGRKFDVSKEDYTPYYSEYINVFLKDVNTHNKYQYKDICFRINGSKWNIVDKNGSYFEFDVNGKTNKTTIIPAVKYSDKYENDIIFNYSVKNFDAGFLPYSSFSLDNIIDGYGESINFSYDSKIPMVFHTKIKGYGKCISYLSVGNMDKNEFDSIWGRTVSSEAEDKIFVNNTYHYTTFSRLDGISDNKGNNISYKYFGDEWTFDDRIMIYVLSGNNVNGIEELDSKRFSYQESFANYKTFLENITFNYEVSITDRKNITKYIYNRNHQLKTKSIHTIPKKIGEIDVHGEKIPIFDQGKKLEEINYTYEDELFSTYKQKNITNTSEYRYTHNSDGTFETGDYSKGQKYQYDEYSNLVADINNERTISYEYNYSYCMPTKQSVTVHTTGTPTTKTIVLTPDLKSIQSETEGGITRNYTYYTDGRVSTSAIEGTGVTTSYAYNDAIDTNTRAVTITTSGMKKADKVTPAPNIEELLTYNRATGTLVKYQCGDTEQSYSYDELGRPTNFYTKKEGGINAEKRINYIKNLDGTYLQAVEVIDEKQTDKINPDYKTRTVYDSTGVKQYEQEFYKLTNTWRTISQIFYKANGLVDYTRDADGNRIDFAYDDLGRATSQSVPAITKVSSAGTAVPVQYNKIYYIDSQKRKVSCDANNTIVISEYDNFGRETKVYRLKSSSADILTRAVANAPLNFAANEYDLTTKEYDGRGNVKRIYEKDIGNQKSFDYDGLGRLTTVISYVKERDSINYMYFTSYEYDSYGNVTIKKQKKSYYKDFVEVVVDTKTISTKEYDGLGRIVKDIDNSEKAEIYEYDSKSNLYTLTDKKGNIFRYTYTPDNKVKMTEVMLKDTTAYKTIKNNQYDDAGNVTYTDKLNKETNNYDGITYLYDVSSKLKKITYKDGSTGLERRIGYDYDIAGRKNKMQSFNVIDNSYDNEYFYDEAGRLYKQNSNVNLIEYGYNTDNTLKTVKYPGGITHNYEYDAQNRISVLIIKKLDGSQYLKYDYTYDDIGNILTRTETKNGQKKSEYTYDDMNRLENVTETENGQVVSLREYSYDVRNNIDTQLTKKYETGVYKYDTYRQYTYDAENRLTDAADRKVEKISNNTIRISTVGTEVYKYDDNGNMINANKNGNTSEYSYDEENNLTRFVNSTTTAEYSYYADGMRASKKIGTDTTKYYYDGGNIINEMYNGTNSATNVFGLKGIAGRINSAGTREYFIKNEHGDTVNLAKSDGTIDAEYSYDEYGNKKTETENGIGYNPFRYSGEYTDQETGFQYLRARYYNPEIQRFITEDTYEGEITNPQSLNLYGYCEGNPVMYTDPSGHIPKDGSPESDRDPLGYYNDNAKKAGLPPYTGGSSSPSAPTPTADLDKVINTDSLNNIEKLNNGVLSTSVDILIGEMVEKLFPDKRVLVKIKGKGKHGSLNYFETLRILKNMKTLKYITGGTGIIGGYLLYDTLKDDITKNRGLKNQLLSCVVDVGTAYIAVQAGGVITRTTIATNEVVGPIGAGAVFITSTAGTADILDKLNKAVKNYLGVQ